jgi:hypothetical protein
MTPPPFDFRITAYNTDISSHDYANDVSPMEFENQYFNRLKSV